MRFVNRPVMRTVVYHASDVTSTSEEYARLRHFQHSLDILQDPYVVRLTETELPLRAKTIMKRDTYTQRHLNAIVQATKLVEEELGVWASRYHVAECVTRYLDSDKSTDWLEGEESEKVYLATVLSTFQLRHPTPDELNTEGAMTDKLLTLIEILVDQMAREDCSGIVFVQTRAQVEVLSVILANSPQTRNLVRSVTFVGSSSSV
jgi:hypothetical protein